MSVVFLRRCILTGEPDRRTKMDKKEKAVRLVDVGELESSLKKDLAEEEAKGKKCRHSFLRKHRG